MNKEQQVVMYGEIYKNLKLELESLMSKIQKVRENNEFGTYKNLILAFKEVLDLYQKIGEKSIPKEPIVIDHKITITDSTHNVLTTIDDSGIEIKDKAFEINRRMSLYNIIHGSFYKYVHKCIENDNIKVLFFYGAKNKVLQFQNMMHEKEFKDLFSQYISQKIICKDCTEIRFINGSCLKFVSATDNSRGRRCHYAIVDTDIDREVFDNVIHHCTILFDIDKSKMNDKYNIEFIEM